MDECSIKITNLNDKYIINLSVQTHVDAWIHADNTIGGDKTSSDNNKNGLEGTR